jgi:L-ascorbate metabolism protein UlaG (beta-lactamase superfamily)
VKSRCAILFIMTAVCAGVLSCVTFGARTYQERQRGARAGSIFHNGIYHNTVPTRIGSFGAALEAGWKQITDKNRTTPSRYPQIVEWKGDACREPAHEFRITWMGHSTVLIEIDGLRILTDPMFSERASPFEHAGPKRLHPVPIAVDTLPALDAVVISHDHYDHLDYRTILALKDKTGCFCVPLDVGRHLEAWGVPRDRIVEFDWRERKRIGGVVDLVATPARHFSGREPARFNTTLWSSWVIIGKGRRVFFCGDSGMMPEFFQIGMEYGPFDVTLLPIGAYNDKWPDIHMTPEEALEAHRCLAGKVMIPIHWGTFSLSLHGWAEPAERLLIEAGRIDVVPALPRPGESISPDGMAPMAPWWR